MNLELILMSGNDIAEFKKMYSVHFKKDFKYKVKKSINRRGDKQMNITSLEIAQATMDMFFCLFCLIMTWIQREMERQ